MEVEKLLSLEFSLRPVQVQNIINLLDEGCTIPFIARYRKELTGGVDDQTLRAFDDRLKYLRSLDKRKEEVTKAITEQGNMTDEIQLALNNAGTLTEVEDIYRPFKPKRKTRASVAIAKGLEPLAEFILSQKGGKIEDKASEFIDEEKGVCSVEEAIQGAKDIIAEKISDNAGLRKDLREMLVKKGHIKAKLDTQKEGYETYEMYADFDADITKTPSHRILAMNRAENEGCLKVDLELNEELALNKVESEFIVKNSPYEELLKEVCADSYDRLIFPSIEREVRTSLTDSANEQAIKMFKVNLQPLLMQPPLKGKVILGLDPAYRTGCKIAVIDANGNVLDTTVIYPTPPQSKIAEAEVILTGLIKKHNVDVISIGNGTATKESEIFVSNLIKKLDRKVEYAVVNEAGASVYSASKLGASEFPDFDVALRSAVSIARRLQDPLAELIKIDVKSIGVGQYQHDMPQARLTEVLDGVVEDCVNKVGVDVNTASPSLLSYVSGLNSGIAKSIEKFRRENGTIKNREVLKKVPKLGDKAYEQCAGFLRVVGGENVLDNTGVHPESYDKVEPILKHFNMSVSDIGSEKVTKLPQLIEKEGSAKIAKQLNMGEPTLLDIANELAKPGRDIRDELPKPMLKSELLGIENLKPGMVMMGVVRNVIDFGVFVDISVHQDGLVHISEISKDYIKHPSEVLKVGDVVKVKVMSVDLAKKRIQLTIKGAVDDEVNV
mgnify:FL=1